MCRPALLLVLLSAVLVACGDAESTSAPRPDQDSPEAAFRAYVKAAVAGDWDTAYVLHLPSERAKAEVTWERVRGDSTRHEGLARLAAQAGATVPQLATLDLRELFTKIRSREIETGGPELLDRIKHADVVRVDPVPDDEGAVLLRFLYGETEVPMPMKREGARWWMYTSLQALVDV